VRGLVAVGFTEFGLGLLGFLSAGEPSVFSPAARREKEREMRLMHWLQHLPSPSLLSQRKRLVKLRCERLAVRLVAETGSEATQDVHFKDVGIMGSYGAVVADVRSVGALSWCFTRIPLGACHFHRVIIANREAGFRSDGVQEHAGV
jgi:hypothetical protein